METAIQVSHTSGRWDQWLKCMKDRLQALEPFYGQVGAILQDSVKRNFLESRSPWGSPWPPLKHPDRGRTKPLIRTGALMSSIRAEVSNKGLVLASPLPYAAVHQYGGRAGRHHSARIPPRPFLGVRKEDWSSIEAALESYLLAGGI